MLHFPVSFLYGCVVFVGVMVSTLHAFIFPFDLTNATAKSCLTCKYLSDPTHCHHVHKCATPFELCFVGEVVADGSHFYVQQCYPEPGCKNVQRLLAAGTHNLLGDYYNWISCCDVDSCNDRRHQSNVTSAPLQP